VSARDELALEIAGYPVGAESLVVGLPTAREIAAGILAAEYRKPRTITTAEELDALPHEAVVRSSFGVTHEKCFDFVSEATFWSAIGSEDEHTAGKIGLPAAVLYSPEPDQ
jgi:hypothetical protein